MSDQASRRLQSRPSIKTVLLTALIVVSSADSTEREGGEPSVASHTVRVAAMQFEPAELVVKRGSRIVWVNDDLFPHTVTAMDDSFDSGSIDAGSSWTYVATRPGTHVYVCALHPTMQGRLIVQ